MNEGITARAGRSRLSEIMRPPFATRPLPALSRDLPVMQLKKSPPIVDRQSKVSKEYFGAHQIVTVDDVLPDLPSFIGRVCSGYAPVWGELQTPLV
jgi:hypothetical protein